jgi:hypothetical protein
MGWIALDTRVSLGSWYMSLRTGLEVLGVEDQRTGKVSYSRNELLVCLLIPCLVPDQPVVGKDGDFVYRHPITKKFTTDASTPNKQKIVTCKHLISTKRLILIM